MNEKGKFSGNLRLSPKGKEEPDSDNEYTRDMWLEDALNDPEFEEDIKKSIEKHRECVKMTMDPKDLVVHMVAESHIDCAWLWRFEQTRRKAYKTFKKAVYHAKRFPNKFVYALSEPLLLQWIKEDEPELFKEIQDVVKTGGIELVGGSFVEPDCMMPSGEAFVRERLYGMRFYRDNFGVLPKVEWFLDSFGYNYGLPQILVKSGAKYFWTTKITWNYYTTFPFVNFWWQGPDGTRILTANFGMGHGPVESWMRFEMGHRPLKKDGRKVWNYEMGYEDIDEHVDMDRICPHTGYFFGRGDGGHGPTHQEVAIAMTYEKIGYGKWSRAETFYDELAKWADDFPVWNDELYLENHQGCFSNHSQVKRGNRKFENLLTTIESLGIITSLANPSFKHPMESIEDMWIRTLKNQFHDVLPGSSIPEVYDDCWDDWEYCDKEINRIIKEVGKALGKETQKKPQTAYIYLYNQVSWKRTDRVFIPISIFTEPPKLHTDGKPNYIRLTSVKGNQFIGQPIAAEPEGTVERMPAGWWAVVTLESVSITPFTVELLSDEESMMMKSSAKVEANGLKISANGTFIELDAKTGAMLTLKVDGINGGQNLVKGTHSNLSYAYLDDSKEWPAWNLTREYWKYPLDMTNDKDVSISVAESGPVFIKININRTFGVSPVTQTIEFFSGCQEIYMQYLTNWKTEKALIKVAYDTTTNADKVVADICYSAIERSTKPKSASDKARFEKICHKYIDLSTPDNLWGIAIVNEGKYAFDATGGEMRLSMLRSPLYPGPAGEAWVIEERKINKEKYGHEVPNYSELGPFKCRYALLPHTGGALVDGKGKPNAVVKRSAEQFNQPIVVIPTEGFSQTKLESVNKATSIIEIEPANVYLGVLKYNEWEKTGTIILRVVETSGIPTEAKVVFNQELGSKIKSVKPVDLLERPIEAHFVWNASNQTLAFPIRGFEILTFEISL